MKVILRRQRGHTENYSEQLKANIEGRKDNYEDNKEKENMMTNNLFLKLLVFPMRKNFTSMLMVINLNDKIWFIVRYI